MRNGKAAAFAFFPGDWTAALDLAACSLAAQGLWMRMLCYMHGAPVRGAMVLPSGQQITPEVVAPLRPRRRAVWWRVRVWVGLLGRRMAKWTRSLVRQG